MVTSSRGLCGGFNSSILKEAQKEIDADWEEPYIFAIGTKGKEYLKKEDIRSAETIWRLLKTYRFSRPEK